MSKLSTIPDPEFLANPTTRYFGRTSGFFLGLQADCDPMARCRELGGDLELIEPRPG
jgi:hypothetical protein